MSHFVGPFNYALYKYLRDNPSKGIWQDIILYRDVRMNQFDIYSYYLSLNDVICFPSFTSTSLSKNLNFESSAKAKKVNNTSINDFPGKMIFRYKYEKGNISPGILIMNESQFSNELEVILFPFTFVRVSDIRKEGNRFIIILDIVKRNTILEYELKRNCTIDLCTRRNQLVIQ